MLDLYVLVFEKIALNHIWFTLAQWVIYEKQSGKKMEPEGETIRLELYIFGLQFIDLNISRLIIMAKTQPESSRYQSKSVYLQSKL